MNSAPPVTISVIIPAYNAEHFIRETIESVLAQTHPAYEIVVVDDGSTDGTKDVVLAFGAAVRYVQQENAGISTARNTGISTATGNWIAFLDSDDLMKPNKLEIQTLVIEANPHLVVVYSAFDYLYEDGSTQEMAVFPSSDLWPGMRYRQPILPSTALVFRAALLEVGGFTVSTRRFFPEDWDLWFRLVQRYSPARFHEVSESLTLYRQSTGQFSKNLVPISEAVIERLDNLLLADLEGLTKAVWKRKIEARLYYRLAVHLRENQDANYWMFALASFTRWPFSGAVVPLDRYKVLLHMVIKKAMRRQLSVSHWLPKNNCREFLRRNALVR